MKIREMWSQMAEYWKKYKIAPRALLLVLVALMGIFIWINAQNIALFALALALFLSLKKRQPTTEDRLLSETEGVCALLYQGSLQISARLSVIRPLSHRDLLHDPAIGTVKGIPCLLLQYYKKSTDPIPEAHLILLRRSAQMLLGQQFTVVSVDDLGDEIRIAVTFSDQIR